MNTTTADLEAKNRTDRKEGFAKWKDQSATRMMMSMIPASDKPEVLETLLQETFNAGYGCGSGKMIMTLLEGILKDKRPDR